MRSRLLGGLKNSNYNKEDEMARDRQFLWFLATVMQLPKRVCDYFCKIDFKQPKPSYRTFYKVDK